jgi:hypothetical protein
VAAVGDGAQARGVAWDGAAYICVCVAAALLWWRHLALRDAPVNKLVDAVVVLPVVNEGQDQPHSVLGCRGDYVIQRLKPTVIILACSMIAQAAAIQGNSGGNDTS